jgi:hypothetical protein
MVHDALPHFSTAAKIAGISWDSEKRALNQR